MPLENDGGYWISIEGIFLGIKTHTTFMIRNSIVAEIPMQYLNNRTKAFDVYFISVRNRSCSLKYV
jgi:hypothetical protein